MNLAFAGLTCCANIYMPKISQYDTEGREIIFLAQKNASGGAHAKYCNGVPTVQYDSWFLTQFPREFQEFIFEHEIAHFQLGHVPAQNSRVPLTVSKSIEPEADCQAIRSLRDRLRYTPEQLSKVYRSAHDFFGEKRADHLWNCLQQK